MEQFKEGGMMKELDDLNAEIAQAEKKIAEVEDEVKMKEPEIAEER
jgi:predicted  nucleic acid-binding Zn-ribbon protein